MGEQPGHAAPPLLEREQELADIRRAVEAAAAGEGHAVLIEGPPGAGKTRLLRAARRRASEADYRVLSARGEEYERDFAYGLARQLFEPLLREIGTESKPLDVAARLALGLGGTDERLPDPGGAARLALYSLVSRLAQGAPVLITVDDLQWADLASARWLAYLTRRLSDHASAVVATVGPGAADDVTATLRAVATEPGVITLRPGPLSRTAVEALVENAFACRGEDRFVHAVHHATGGNPFLVHELLTTLRSAGVMPIGAAATRIGSRAPDRVTNSALARVGRLGHDALEVARAVAVFGEARVRHVALLTALDQRAAAAAADALASADLFVAGRPLRFGHGLIRSAVYSAMRPGARDAAHYKAARIMADGDELDRAAGHLLAVEPRGDPWIVAVLRRSAAAATARGAPEAAVAYLRRVLGEPPPADELAQVLLSLGAAEDRTGNPASVEHFRRAVELAESDAERGLAGRELGRALTHLGRFDEAIAVLEQALSHVDAADRDLALELETLLLNAEQFEPRARPAHLSHRRRLEREVDGRTRAGRLLLADLAFDAAKRAAPAVHAVNLAQRAFDDGELLEGIGPTGMTIYGALIPLVLADRFDLAEEWIAQADAAARARGWLDGRAVASIWLARVALARGRVGEACEQARRALEHAESTESGLAFPQAAAVLIEASLVHQGPTSFLDELAQRPITDAIARLPYVAELLLARGRLSIARGRLREGLSDLFACRERLEAYGLRNPALVQWRAVGAPALVAAGRPREGLDLAREGTRLAQAFGAPSSLSLALRTEARVAGGDGSLQLFEEALALVEISDARLAQAEALTDLGAALRRSGRRREARDSCGSPSTLPHAALPVPSRSASAGNSMPAGPGPAEPCFGGRRR